PRGPAIASEPDRSERDRHSARRSHRGRRAAGSLRESRSTLRAGLGEDEYRPSRGFRRYRRADQSRAGAAPWRYPAAPAFHAPESEYLAGGYVILYSAVAPGVAHH